MTKFEDIKKSLENGAKAIIGLNVYVGASSVEAFSAKYANDFEALHYAQTRIMFPGVKYRTNVLAAH